MNDETLHAGVGEGEKKTTVRGLLNIIPSFTESNQYMLSKLVFWNHSISGKLENNEVVNKQRCYYYYR